MGKINIRLPIAVAVAAMGMAGAGQVSAADLGGNCCADLEERIAELEATTARKGNRKVSLTISGWVTEQIVHWDDGFESDTYLTGLGTNYASNVNFSGSAQISPGWKAGFYLHLESIDNNVYGPTQTSFNGIFGDSNSVNTKQSYWYIQSAELGKLSIGKQSPVGDNAAFGSDLSGTTAAAYWVGYDVWSFRVKTSTGADAGLDWAGNGGSGGTCHGWGGGPGDCVGSPRQEIRYDSPAIAGFMLHASWGQDDEWGVTGDYTGTWGDFTGRGVVSYSETTDSTLGAPPSGKLQYTQIGSYLEHNPSGVWGTFQWGHMEGDGYEDNDVYYAKGGIHLKLTALGTTTPYGEYLFVDNGVYNDKNVFLAGADTTYWGGGVVQNIDAAAMQVWLRYRNHDMDIPGLSTESIETIVAGAFIAF